MVLQKSASRWPLARRADGLFFPQREALGLDSREVTPELTRAVVHLASEIRSFQRAEVTTERVLGQKVPRSTIRRLAKQTGVELAALAQRAERVDGKEVVVPEVAIVSCDRGRIRTRRSGHGRSVRLSGESGWRETKNASFERMVRKAGSSGEADPCPDLPTSFRTASHVAKIAEKPVPDVASCPAESTDETSELVRYEGPRRVLRTAVSSMASSEAFGPMMQREARRRRFHEAPWRAFLGDGLAWNWSIWRKYFCAFVPILDFIHAIEYVFAAASAIAAGEAEAWSRHVRLITWCWQGHVESVIQELCGVAQQRGLDLEIPLAEDDPHRPLADAVRYLSNNYARMDYPRYRRLRLPVTSAPMESLIKQINHRVKGTEMFWDDPAGAEAILHLRAAALSEDHRLDDYLSRRPGYPFVQRPQASPLAA